ncbi:hypothetical protein LTR95_015687, partial [Oleoguttula sp. CCFEE 5521]
MIAVLRATVVYRVWHVHQQGIRRYVKAGRSEREAKAKSPSLHEGVQRRLDQFMTVTKFQGHSTPLDRIFPRKTYGMKTRYTTTGGRRVLWIGEGRLMNDISMDGIRTVVNGLSDTVSTEEIQAEFLQCRDESIEWYSREVRRFKEESMVLVHVSAGAPARASELISIQHQNRPQAGSQRRIFIDNGMAAFITGYHKGYKMGHRVRIVHRYVPREVREVVANYLRLMELFVRSLQ